MAYLIYNDYKKSIQSLNLSQVIGGDLSILNSWQKIAQEEAESYLTQKYAVEVEFTDTTRWDPTKIYFAADRIYLDAGAYNTATNYLLNDLCLNNGTVYIANAPTTGAFDLTKWIAIGAQYEMFYVTYPYELFNLNTYYKRGVQVFWDAKIWTAASDSSSRNELNIQYGNTRNVPPINAFPGSTEYPQQWGTGVAYSIAAGMLPTDTSKWTRGDNRGQQILQKVIDITIYYIHKRVAPQNVPITRKDDYNMAIQWLVDAGTGVVTPKLPLRQPNQGNRMRFGGRIPLNNHY